MVREMSGVLEVDSFNRRSFRLGEIRRQWNPSDAKGRLASEGFSGCLKVGEESTPFSQESTPIYRE